MGGVVVEGLGEGRFRGGEGGRAREGEEAQGRDERRVREKVWVGAGRGDEAEDAEWGIESDGVRGCGEERKAGLRGGYTDEFFQP